MCALRTFNFQNLMVFKLRLLNTVPGIFKIISFNFCKMFENAQFFKQRHSKFARSAHLKKKISPKSQYRASKYSEFYVNYQYVDMC